MPLAVRLSDVVEQLSIVSDDFNVYLNRKTGEFVVLSSEDMFGFDEEEAFSDDSLDDNSSEGPEWVEEAKRIRRAVFESDDYIQLTDKFKINDWRIMDDFCLSLRKADLRDELRDLIRGRVRSGDSTPSKRR